MVDYFCKTLHLRCFSGFWICLWITYVFCHGSKRVTWKHWYMPNWLQYFLQTFFRIFPLFWSHTWKWKRNIQVNKMLTKVNEKWSTIQFDAFSMFCSFFHFIHSIVQDNKFHKQKWHMLFFTCIKLMMLVVVCVHAIAHIKSIRLVHHPKFLYLLKFSSETHAILLWNLTHSSHTYTHVYILYFVKAATIFKIRLSSKMQQKCSKINELNKANILSHRSGEMHAMWWIKCFMKQ